MTDRTRTALDQDALEMALQDDRHNGYGYAESNRLPRRLALALDEAVIIAANLAAWDYERLFEFTNDKAGRHLVDEATRYVGGSVPDSMDLVPLATRYVK